MDESELLWRLQNGAQYGPVGVMPITEPSLAPQFATLLLYPQVLSVEVFRSYVADGVNVYGKDAVGYAVSGDVDAPVELIGVFMQLDAQHAPESKSGSVEVRSLGAPDLNIKSRSSFVVNEVGDCLVDIQFIPHGMSRFAYEVHHWSWCDERRVFVREFTEAQARNVVATEESHHGV